MRATIVQFFRITLLPAVLLAVVMIHHPVLASPQNPKKISVLVLHSYHKGLSWTDTITEGIEQRFNDEGVNVEYSYEFMDTKRHFSKEHYANLERLYRHKYRESDFDLIISSDDNAYHFLLQKSRDLFPGVPVVFCAVNNFLPHHIRELGVFTGVAEDLDFKATVEIALKLQDGINKIVFICDETTTGKANRDRMVSIFPEIGGNISFEFMDLKPMREVRQYVSGLKDGTIVFWLHFTVDKNGRFFSFEDSAEMISEASRVPLYSSWDFHMDHGIVGGMITSGLRQGYTAAGLALRIAAGEKPGEIPVMTSSPNQYMFDHNQLERFDISPSRLPQSSVVINQPESRLVQSKEFLLSILGGFLILGCIILLLSVSNIRRLRAEQRATAAKNRYLGIFNDTGVALLVEDFSDLIGDFQVIKKKGEGDFRRYFLNNPEVVAALGRRIRIRDANPAALTLYGIENKEQLDGILGHLVAPEKSDSLVGFLVALLEGDRSFTAETVNRTLAGELVNVILEAKLPRDYLEYSSILVSIIDITERKRAEQALMVSETRFRAAFDSAATGMALLSVDGRYLKINRALCSTLGYREDELLRKSWKDVTHPEDLEKSDKNIERLLAGENHELVEKRYFHKSGEVVWVLLSGALIFDSEGKPSNIISQFQDITERKRAEEKLLEQKERYRKYFEDDLSGVFVANDQAKLVTSNQAFRAIFGIDKSAVTGEIDLLQFFREKTEGRDFFNTLVVKRKLEQYELHLRKTDGTPLDVVLNAIGRFDENGMLFEVQGYVMDVTHQKALETQLFQAQKLESIGTMAGGVAHDFNNLLMGVLGNASLLLFDKDERHPDYGRLKNIEEYVRSGSSLTKQLLGFAKGGKYEVKTLDINEIIHHNAGLFSQTRKEVEIELQLDCRNGAVDVDQGQIDQVMYNLYVNAWQAMIDGGRIEIRTANLNLEEDFAESHSVPAGMYVKIEVEDNGEGMDQETLQRIFDPFFTTKEISRGIGLGLASSYGIIQNHSGIIEAESEPGVGTCFSIYLPVSSRDPLQKDSAIEQNGVAKGRENVLIVDDEEMIIGVGTQMLKALGYEVQSAYSGREAIELLKQSPQQFDLIILDMIMPGMSGGETFDAFRKINPEVRVILCSGYSLDEKSSAILERGCLGFLQKPFDLRSLSEKVRDVLGSSRREDQIKHTEDNGKR